MGWIHLGWCIGASEHFGLGAWRCVEKVGSLYLDALMGRMGLSTFCLLLALWSVAWDTNRMEDQNLRNLAGKRSISCFVLKKKNREIYI